MIYVLSLLLFLAAFAGLAAGVLLRRRPLRGGCGGHRGLGERLSCTGCDCAAPGEKPVRALTLLR